MTTELYAEVDLARVEYMRGPTQAELDYLFTGVSRLTDSEALAEQTVVAVDEWKKAISLAEMTAYDDQGRADESEGLAEVAPDATRLEAHNLKAMARTILSKDHARSDYDPKLGTFATPIHSIRNNPNTFNDNQNYRVPQAPWATDEQSQAAIAEPLQERLANLLALQTMRSDTNIQYLFTLPEYTKEQFLSLKIATHISGLAEMAPRLIVRGPDSQTTFNTLEGKHNESKKYQMARTRVVDAAAVSVLNLVGGLAQEETRDYGAGFVPGAEAALVGEDQPSQQLMLSYVEQLEKTAVYVKERLERGEQQLDVYHGGRPRPGRKPLVRLTQDEVEPKKAEVLQDRTLLTALQHVHDAHVTRFIETYVYHGDLVVRQFEATEIGEWPEGLDEVWNVQRVLATLTTSEALENVGPAQDSAREVMHRLSAQIARANAPDQPRTR